MLLKSILFFYPITSPVTPSALQHIKKSNPYVNPTVPDQPSIVKLISIAILGVYEVVVWIIPSVKDYSVVSWIIKALKKVSDTLNKKIDND